VSRQQHHDFSTITQGEIGFVLNQLNRNACAVLRFRQPSQDFFASLAVAAKTKNRHREQNNSL
jgi:hypothetical protein